MKKNNEQIKIETRLGKEYIIPSGVLNIELEPNSRFEVYNLYKSHFTGVIITSEPFKRYYFDKNEREQLETYQNGMQNNANYVGRYSIIKQHFNPEQIFEKYSFSDDWRELALFKDDSGFMYMTENDDLTLYGLDSKPRFRPHSLEVLILKEAIKRAGKSC